MKWTVNNPDGFATNLKSFAGADFTITNNSTTDVYYTTEANGGALNASLSGTIPAGTKIPASGGTVQFRNAPHSIWVRAQFQTTLDIEGDAASLYAGSKQATVAGSQVGGMPNRRTTDYDKRTPFRKFLDRLK